MIYPVVDSRGQTGAEQLLVGGLPLILSTVVMISLRAYISALSSVGLPSFRLSFFLSALRRFFDDLLRAASTRMTKPSTEGTFLLFSFSLRRDAGVALRVFGGRHHAAGFRVQLCF